MSALADKPIFITARFRSGSTMLWNLFRQIPGCKTYYEPCHDNLIAHVLGDTPVQESHRGVTSYWDEYRSLMPRLEEIHSNDFGVCRLFLEAGDDWPELEHYLRFLLDQSRPLRPVLQFNRVDFRLSWLRARFPEATILHLYRDPRDQWLSMVKDVPAASLANPDENTNYDLAVWAASLSSSFPFLVGAHIQHSYERHYLIWKLSYLMGSRGADLSLSYDRDFVETPLSGLGKLLQAVGANPDTAADLAPNIVKRVHSVRAGAPSAEEFARMETSGDDLLDRLGLTDRLGKAPLADIRRDFKSVWTPFGEQAHEAAVRLSFQVFSRFRSHYLDTVSLLRQLDQNAQNVVNALAEKERQFGELRKALEQSSGDIEKVN